MIPPLVSFDVAKRHLRILVDNHDADIDAKLRLASAIVANHCKLRSIPDEWTVDPEEVDYDSTDLLLASDVLMSPPDSHYIRVPGNIQAAILLVLSDLFENREASTSGLLSDTIVDLLSEFRDPSHA